jgi:ATP-dependent DNA helicase RecQ
VLRVTDRPLELLHAIAGRDASFRQGQREAIDAVVADRRRVLPAQRIGWGKSAVYFIATRLLRDAAAGPTILVSPERFNNPVFRGEAGSGPVSPFVLAKAVND